MKAFILRHERRVKVLMQPREVKDVWLKEALSCARLKTKVDASFIFETDTKLLDDA